MQLNNSKSDKTTAHYQDFINDVRPHRKDQWLSIFHQISEPMCLADVHSVLEFGPGRGLTGAILRHYGIEYFAVDVSDRLCKPDAVSTISEFETEKTYDMVSAFQALEHNPPETFVPHLQKMAALSNRYVFVSLPWSGRWISYNISLHLPRINKTLSRVLSWPRTRSIIRPVEKYRTSETPFAHHWFEIGDSGFKEHDVARMAKEIDLSLIKTYHTGSFPFHIFFLFEKT